MSKICTHVNPNEPQVTLGQKDDKSFTYDVVYDMEARQEHVFETSVRGLVEGCLEGYNATVLAYGQTGSGKTFTMGTAFERRCCPAEDVGIIPRAVAFLFEKIHRLQQQAGPQVEFSVMAQVTGRKRKQGCLSG